jgi:hypothetical protein
MNRTRAASSKSRLGTPPPLTDPGWVPIRSFAFRDDPNIAQEMESKIDKGKGKTRVERNSWTMENPFQSGSSK